jgi:hypothetical protein
VEDHEWQQYRAAATRVELVCDEYYEPDGGIAIDYTGPQLVVVHFSLRVCTLGDGGRSVAELDGAAGQAIVTAARAVITDPDRVRPGVDTAVGRPMTMLRLRVEDPVKPESHSRLAPINHHAPKALPASWSHLLALLHDAAGPLPDALEELWDLALVWSKPADLGPIWRDGHAVPVPHRVTAVDARAPIYLRTGQEPAPSSLYLVDPDERAIKPIAAAGAEPPPATEISREGWTALPCGGAALQLHDDAWGEPPRLLVRVTDSERWAYVQRA